MIFIWHYNRVCFTQILIYNIVYHAQIYTIYVRFGWYFVSLCVFCRQKWQKFCMSICNYAFVITYVSITRFNWQSHVEQGRNVTRQYWLWFLTINRNFVWEYFCYRTLRLKDKTGSRVIIYDSHMKGERY